ncbi:MAG: M56 family metallopeptidase [Clostridiales bacterium]|nr:M56 family metallopeptidase [Clostridiales bacterium]
MSLLQMSFAGAVMILAIIVIRALAINLLPKKTFLALWGIAVMRLLLPFSLPSAFSVYSLIDDHIPMTAPAKVPQAFEVLPAETNGQMFTMPSGISNTASSISAWAIIWGVGMLVCALVFAIAYWKCRQEFQTSLPVDNGFIRGWLSSHRLKRTISVRQSSRFSAPLTYGVFCPVILMPTSTDWENTKSLQYVLAHEYVHIRRFDSITKLVLITALCVHWFNPLVWAMYVLANRDIELSCDEAVVRLFGENTKAAYARSLISMEETRSGLTPLCNNFNKNAIEERITAIMKIKKTSIFSLALAVALIVGVTTVFATSAFASSGNEGEKPANVGLDLTPSSNRQITEKSINLADSNNAAGLVQLVGDQAVDSQATISLNDLNREDATSILENTQPMELTLISVSHDDERKFAPEEWAEILELIEQGKVYWED